MRDTDSRRPSIRIPLISTVDESRRLESFPPGDAEPAATIVIIVIRSGSLVSVTVVGPDNAC